MKCTIAELALQTTPLNSVISFIGSKAALFANVFLAGFDGTVTASTYAAISSSFLSSNTASWITTSYLLTSTAIQPLYGRFSDIFGRRICLLIATTMFCVGCLGCSLALDIVSLDIMRAVTGIGGGGLMTMATIINSDIVPQRHRGTYQAVQNMFLGLGSIMGASVGGFIADNIGWRYCFLLQVPISVVALIVAYHLVTNSSRKQYSELEDAEDGHVSVETAWNRVDVAGAMTMVIWLSLQTAALSMGSNVSNWSDSVVVACLVGSAVFLIIFVVAEMRTAAAPIMPLRMLRRLDRIALLVANVCLGIAAYGFLFLMPLFFQAVLLDRPSTAGLRLVAPALSTPIGSLVTGYLMARGDHLNILTRVGLATFFVSACLVSTLGRDEPSWKYSLYLMLGNLGQGIAFPSSLFAFIRASSIDDHAVATSLIYLSRSMGSVWGVAAVSTISQSFLSYKLDASLSHLPNREEVIQMLKSSVEAIHRLTPDVREIAQQAYYESCQQGFYFLLVVCGVATVASFLVAHPKRYIP
ncbi:MFS drug transporter [Thozetella sp. PMI_491]|nr:MFS drug transporter [Thozetella sp. PMI_491]